MKQPGLFFTVTIFLLLAACKKSGNATTTPPPTEPPASFSFNSLKVNGAYKGLTYYGVNPSPVLQLSFLAPIDHASVNTAVTLKTSAGVGVTYTTSYANSDSTIIIQPASPLQAITKYVLGVTTALQSKSKGSLQSPITVSLTTAIDSADKFPRISDDALLDKVQAQTLKYFYDFGHPVSGLARERTSSGDLVTSGGSGFGIMAMLAAAQRNFITRTQALNRIDTIVTFLTDKTTRYHGAFSHWINGATGATIPFGTQDNGGDIVETAYMLQGLLCARQYFNSTTDAKEISLRGRINDIWNAVDWTWYRKDGRNILYWNWSPDYNWAINTPVKGWNEALITYVLAASSANYAIPKTTYDSGWAANGAIRNGSTYYGTVLPLGPGFGGPLFFAHYSFLGIDPHGLSDAYANYWTQDTAHARINYNYCVANPQGFYGYSAQCWGLTASDDNISGYAAHSPTNDLGIIAPTAAISSLPFTPTESLNALRFFYYTLGDKAWGQYGFVDAFNLVNPWFDTDCLAIDQGPEMVMIENYRSGLLWHLFMSCPEVQTGLKKLGFQGPGL
ncbi:glucoamylase family protein [Flavitalea sp. BT771]|uniref:glucoamylase family protein n=1 Tax=Flavitalea sp. BT771 TaxID=3063329 RepID=UPI0026E2937D|nr:glucoamylase family protein [Flavitalea sp. BT771]MDO6433533.1 glucoamylase family protein [Flavitalea sp. BT771]MDV6222562.1 glucoamylase family protein [Flavitalea sp. BT771]